jgi:FlaA1/EpsC-like NDP-sugar epimerase
MDDWIKGTGNLSQLEKINIGDLLGRQWIKILNKCVQELLNKKSILVIGGSRIDW